MKLVLCLAPFIWELQCNLLTSILKMHGRWGWQIVASLCSNKERDIEKWICLPRARLWTDGNTKSPLNHGCCHISIHTHNDTACLDANTEYIQFCIYFDTPCRTHTFYFCYSLDFSGSSQSMKQQFNNMRWFIIKGKDLTLWHNNHIRERLPRTITDTGDSQIEKWVRGTQILWDCTSRAIIATKLNNI